jgi:hypothetical protein
MNVNVENMRLHRGSGMRRRGSVARGSQMKKRNGSGVGIQNGNARRKYYGRIGVDL